MKQAHKYFDEIVHWAKGGELQCCYHSDEFAEWIDYLIAEMPDFNSDDIKWRIKPEMQDFTYRVAIMQDDLEKPIYWPNTAFTQDEARVIQKEGAFLKWLTDWEVVKKVEL